MGWLKCTGSPQPTVLICMWSIIYDKHQMSGVWNQRTRSPPASRFNLLRRSGARTAAGNRRTLASKASRDKDLKLGQMTLTAKHYKPWICMKLSWTYEFMYWRIHTEFMCIWMEIRPIQIGKGSVAEVYRDLLKSCLNAFQVTGRWRTLPKWVSKHMLIGWCSARGNGLCAKNTSQHTIIEKN